MTHLHRILPVALVLLVAVPGGAMRPLDVPDADQDGVADAMDACPDTPAGDLVDATGCSVCPCDATADGTVWSSHREYLGCVVAAAKSRLRARTMRARELRKAVRQARVSTCGDAALTRCCIYPNEDAEIGSCRPMQPEQCVALDGDQVVTEDLGPGSCAPNPCVP